jgi:hypothetical protein
MNGNVCIPYELFTREKLCINHFRIFGCSVVARKWSTKQKATGKQTEHGIRGIFLGFDNNQNGYLFYAPGSRQIFISCDILFDELFGMATYQDSFSILNSYIPTVDSTFEQTGIILDFPVITEEGKAEEHDTEADDDYDLPDLLHPDDVSSAYESKFNFNNFLDLETDVGPDTEEESPQPITCYKDLHGLESPITTIPIISINMIGQIAHHPKTMSFHMHVHQKLSSPLQSKWMLSLGNQLHLPLENF